MPADEVTDLLNVLADAGLIERHGIEGGRPGAFVLALTPEGRRVAKGEERPELALSTGAPRRGRRARAPRRSEASLEGSLEASLAASGSTPSATSRPRRTEPAASRATSRRDAAAVPPDAELLERLKLWRREEARRKNLPSYVIFHDSTLEELAAIHPRDREGLERVRGIGPAKLEAYGDALLGLLA